MKKFILAVSLLVAAPAMAADTPLTCLQAVSVLAELTRVDFDRSADIDRSGSKVPLMTLMLYARNTEDLCAAELGAR